MDYNPALIDGLNAFAEDLSDAAYMAVMEENGIDASMLAYRYSDQDSDELEAIEHQGVVTRLSARGVYRRVRKNIKFYIKECYRRSERPRLFNEFCQRGIKHESVVEFMLGLNSELIYSLADRVGFSGAMTALRGELLTGKLVKVETRRLDVNIEADRFFECVQKNRYGRIARDLEESLERAIEPPCGICPFKMVFPTGPWGDDSGEILFSTQYGVVV